MSTGRDKGYNCDLNLKYVGERHRRDLRADSIGFNPNTRWTYQGDVNRFLEFGITYAVLEVVIEHGAAIPGSGDDFAPMPKGIESEETTESHKEASAKTGKSGFGAEAGIKDGKKTTHTSFTVLPSPRSQTELYWQFNGHGKPLGSVLKSKALLTKIKATNIKKLAVKYRMRITVKDIEILGLPIDTPPSRFKKTLTTLLQRKAAKFILSKDEHAEGLLLIQTGIDQPNYEKVSD